MLNKITSSKTIILQLIIILILLTITVSGAVMPKEAYSHNYDNKNLPPSLEHPFGTDFMGRDMFCRTIKGLSVSIWIGISASVFSALIALALGIFSAYIGGITDKITLLLIDIFMGIPHLVLLMLISFAVGKGLKGVVIGVIFTHWPALTRVIRGEVLVIKESYYVKAASKFGKGSFEIAVRHILPHALPQFVVGLILLFPHAIAHEASITFLGFGLSVDQPAVGVILAEAMKYMATGNWWLVLFPGLSLVAVIMLFFALGDRVNAILEPKRVLE